MYRWKRLATLQRIFPPKLGIKVVIWKDLDPDQSQALKDALTLQNVKTILAEIFNLTNYAEDLREAILLNLYTYTLQYARDEDFTIDKLSTYFSIVKDAHEFCTKSSFINLDETFSYFKELLLCHSVYCPPFSTELFTLGEVRKISFHMINTYFRHFKLYKYAFTPQVQLDLALVYIGEPESITNQVDHQISENRGSQATDENIDKENEPARISEKEKIDCCYTWKRMDSTSFRLLRDTICHAEYYLKVGATGTAAPGLRRLNGPLI
ncbi:cilia- and flagella-associated protein 119 isoform X2 [Octopus bimaculoides]|uniref:cilia- and flagella-associated protein 119 isoform X2 n=1 Tax=Octopus bimaculoides TaxID=37653 RepID=UPI0022E0104C|nr:cilia- and flagella-associated protein 119 isoform X2 [Octopus bimaculoides]